MKKNLWKVLCGVLVVVFLVTCMTTLFACKDKPVTPDNPDNPDNPSNPDNPTEDTTAKILNPENYVVPTIKAGTTGTSSGTLVVGYNYFNEKFSPFFATSAYDVDVYGMTQVGLLASDRGGNIIYNGIEGEVVPYNGTDYTYYGIADLKVTQNDDGSVDYTIYLAKGVKFSDGSDLTVKDVIFTMYALSDVDYDGSTTFYTLPIEGMAEWRTNLKGDVYAKYMAIAEAVLKTFNTETGEFVYAESNLYTKAQYDGLVAAISAPTGAWKALAEDIVSYCLSKYDSYAGGGNKYSGKNGLNLKKDEQTIALGMSMWGFGSFGSAYGADEDGNVGLVDGAYKNLWTTTDDEDAASFADAEGNLYKRVASKDDAAFLLGAKIEDGVYSVTAYTGDRYKVTGYNAIFTDSNGKTYDTEANEFPTISDYVDCLMAGYDNNLYQAISVEKANLDFDGYVGTVIEPWVASAGQADMNGEKINSISGITYSETNYIINVHTTEYSATTVYQLSLAVAPMAYYGSTSLWDPANGSYGFTRGNLNALREKTTKPMGAGPYKFVEYKDGIVTFEANSLYWEGVPKTQYVKFKEMADADKVPAVVSGDIDIANPSISDSVLDNIKTANGNDEIAVKQELKVSTDLVDNNGYGYLGINSENVLVGTDKGSEASKNFRKGFMTLFGAYREYTVNSYYHERASVIEYPISNCSWAAPQPADEGYEAAFAKDVNGNAIYTANMTEQQRWDAAKAAAIGYFKAAGLTWDEGTGKFTAAPEGAKLQYEIIIGGDGTGDHPTFALLLKCQEVLESIGITLDITDDSDNLFDRMEDGTVDMFVAAWGGSSDPDMYQVYHSDNKTNSNHYRIADAELDSLIMEARKSADKNFRKATYKDCLDVILDWAVELPVYQRKNCYVYSGERVVISSITPDTTPFWSYLSEIYNLEVK